MSQRAKTLATAMLLLTTLVGCRSTRAPFVGVTYPQQPASIATTKAPAPIQGPEKPKVVPTSLVVDDEAIVDPLANNDVDGGVERIETTDDDSTASNIPPGTEVVPTPEGVDTRQPPEAIRIVRSVRLHYPVVREAAANRIIASGEALSAAGAFDHKLDGYSNGQPLDFYENSWHKWSIKRDTMWGGQVGTTYRLGRGSFEPWYKERETYDAGEFGIFAVAPIWRDVAIDENRAELWRAQLERNRVEPFIQAMLLMAIRDGVQSYWGWVAANRDLEIAEGILQLGLDRDRFIKTEVKVGEKREIDIIDNRRIIVSRQAKVVDARRKLQQSAVKLSLFLRDDAGNPIVLDDTWPSNGFPELDSPEDLAFEGDEQLALDSRPELAELQVVRRQLGVAYQQALNETRVDINTGVFVGQDVGGETSDADKGETELEATISVSVPLERRKALGKVRQLRGKFAQLRAKLQFASDKVRAEVQASRAALLAAAERVGQNKESFELAQTMQQKEQIAFEAGEADLFSLNVREQQLAEAAQALVGARFDFFVALADYTAALGLSNAELEELYGSEIEPPGGPRARVEGEEN